MTGVAFYSFMTSFKRDNHFGNGLVSALCTITAPPTRNLMQQTVMSIQSVGKEWDKGGTVWNWLWLPLLTGQHEQVLKLR